MKADSMAPNNLFGVCLCIPYKMELCNGISPSETNRVTFRPHIGLTLLSKLQHSNQFVL